MSSASRWMTSATAGPVSAACDEGGDRHPRVVLDLGGGGAQHVDHPDRVHPATARRGAGQDDQAFRVAAHAGGQMVEAEEVFQRLRVRRAALHAVQHGEFAVQQRLVTPGQVAEDIVDPAPHPGLADRGLDGRAPGRVERLGDPPDLVPAEVGLFPGQFLDGHVLAAAEPGNDAGQFDAGQRDRRLLEPGEAADDPPADQDGQADGQQQAEQPHAAGQGHPPPGRVGDGLVVRDLGPGRVHAADEVAVQHGLGHRIPLRRGERREGRGISRRSRFRAG